MKPHPHTHPDLRVDTVDARRDAGLWTDWFWAAFFPDWLSRVQDGDDGVFDALDAAGNPYVTADKSLLAQARTLFTLSHVALLSPDPTLEAAARKQAAVLDRFHKAEGLYRCRLSRTGIPTGAPEDDAARSYDHSFIILALVTWNRLSPSPEVSQRIEGCWQALRTQLTDPKTGLLRNDDVGHDDSPAQNPHMHLYEACLQAYRMTGDAVWLTRAAEMRALGIRHFFDPQSGSIAEFLTPDLKPLAGAAGQRREVGHQCEWAWLLLEEAALAQDPALRAPALDLITFADTYGFADDAPLKGAAFDAVSAQGAVTEHRFLLWPQTEAIKTLALRHTAGDPTAGHRARALLCIMFEGWFANRPTFVNQLDGSGHSLWSEALTRLMYHIVLAMTEGARAGLWPGKP